jgi:hypothetical protein
MQVRASIQGRSTSREVWVVYFVGGKRVEIDKQEGIKVEIGEIMITGASHYSYQH